MKAYPLISVVVATFNSERNLTRVLSSLRKQTYPKSQIEVLVVDGGSMDKTVALAKSYKCRVIHNPKTLPQWAKFLGYKAARGKYLMFLDSDEALASDNSIERRINVFQRFSSVRGVTGSGYTSPAGYPFLNRYVNDFGDPFSYFIYRSSTDHELFITSVKRQARIIQESGESVILDFASSQNRPIFELAAMGGVVDLRFVRKNFPEIMTKPALIWHLFNLLISKGQHLAIVKNDPIIHYSVSSTFRYLGKVTSRIVSNIYTPAGEGFGGRIKYAGFFARHKKYLFLPYAFSLVLPLIDSVYLALTRGNIGYFIHLPLCIYTAGSILYFLTLKLIGFRPVIRRYGVSS